jgi:hypothetical protein
VIAQVPTDRPTKREQTDTAETLASSPFYKYMRRLVGASACAWHLAAGNGRCHQASCTKDEESAATAR